MRFTLHYGWYRFMGITGLFLIGYIVVVGIFGNVDVSGLLPVKLAASIQAAWPQMPFFAVQKETINGGKDEETYYIVPTRQLTPREIAQLEYVPSKPLTHPAPAVTAAPTSAR